MRKLIDTIINIWSIEDLRNRILTTLGILAIYRLGTFVVMPRGRFQTSGFDGLQTFLSHQPPLRGVALVRKSRPLARFEWDRNGVASIDVKAMLPSS